MNKSLIIGTLLLIVACSATVAVYFFYFQTRLVELKEHETAMKEIQTRLKALGTTFSNTQPEVVVTTWKNGLQPWYEAALARTDFFNLGDVPIKVEVPDDGFQKFFYMEKHPQLQKALTDHAYNNSCYLGAFDFGVPNRNSMGTNPSREDVSKWLTRFEFGSAVTRLLIDKGASYIENVVIWPMKATNVGATRGAGSIESYTTGVHFSMTFQDLTDFLEYLRTESRYFTINHLRIANTTLRFPGARLEVSMLLTQARYSEESTAVTAATVSTAGRSGASRAGGFSRFMRGGRPGAGPAGPAGGAAAEESWWQGFKKKYLPFLK